VAALAARDGKRRRRAGLEEEEGVWHQSISVHAVAADAAAAAATDAAIAFDHVRPWMMPPWQRRRGLKIRLEPWAMAALIPGHARSADTIDGAVGDAHCAAAYAHVAAVAAAAAVVAALDECGGRALSRCVFSSTRFSLHVRGRERLRGEERQSFRSSRFQVTQRKFSMRKVKDFPS